jgi:hypothetical protein
MLATREDFPESECLPKGTHESVPGVGPAIELQRLLWQGVEQERDMAGVTWLASPPAVGSKSRFADKVDPIVRIGSRVLGPVALVCAVAGLIALFF